MTDLRGAVGERGGVVRVSRLIEAGISRNAVRVAVRNGVLSSPRRGWVAVPDADPYLLAAARAGVVVTCVTRAKRLGLWVRTHDGPHVGVAPTASRLNLGVDSTVHWAAPVQPRSPDTLEDGILSALVILAGCQPYESALATWESALRMGLVRKGELDRLPLRPAARLVRDAVTPFSDSGLETIFASRLSWLRELIRPQVWIEGHRVDFLIGDRLVVQIDGGHHVGPQRTADVSHDAALMLLGYHVIRVTYVQIIERWHEVSDLILRAIAQGLHRAP
ncbi:endonuclease domain-containing protein [Microbacterium timonense]|uniref:endonuclease domain-containing protein n=1 Tax=Microbacterium timonense TaxID=2086576 RepID=UPI000D0FC761|nr:DUF559 domain-containing protein [Microbacterium timonense]